MLFTGNVIALLLAFTSGNVDVSVKLQLARPDRAAVHSPTALELTAGVSAGESRPAGNAALPADGGPSRMDDVHTMAVSVPEANIERVPVGDGFLFFEGRYLPYTTKLLWRNGRVTIEDPTGMMLASNSSDRRGPVLQRIPVRNASRRRGQSSDLRREIRSDLAPASRPQSQTITLGMSAEEMQNISFALSTGGIVHLSQSAPPLTAGHSEGGYELLEALQKSPGKEREKILTVALPRIRSGVTDETSSWLSSYLPDEQLAERVNHRVDELHHMETSNRGAATAVRRLNSWNYPLTIAAMMIFVVSIGTLLSVRPQELVAVAHSEQDISINRFLVLIAGMSVIDLTWTLLAHQANQINEVNPVGNVLLGDALRTIVFKGLATGMAIGIFHRARQNAFARKACWWVCLTLALLMARWVLVSGVSL